MMIDETKFPILGLLKNEKAFSYFPNWEGDSNRTPELMKVYNIFAHIWPIVAPRMRKNIQYITEMYKEAIEKSAPSFVEAMEKDPDLVLGIDNWAGVLICPGTTIAFSFSLKDNQHTFLMTLGEDGSLKMFSFREYPSKGNEIHFVSESGDDYIRETIGRLSLHQLLAYYGKVEEKNVCDCQRVSEDAKEIDDTLKIYLMDSPWYISVCRESCFLTRGHLRLQQKETNGERKSELVYFLHD